MAKHLSQLLNKLPFFDTITGKGDQSPYMTRCIIGRFRLHVMWRKDEDRHPHDHPWGFITFPFTDYFEEVYDPKTGKTTLNIVKRFRFHYRRPEYAHRILGRARVVPENIWDKKRYELDDDGVIVTAVWRMQKQAWWGFYVDEGVEPRRKVHWRDYLGEHTHRRMLSRALAWLEVMHRGMRPEVMHAYFDQSGWIEGEILDQTADQFITELRQHMGVAEARDLPKAGLTYAI